MKKWWFWPTVAAVLFIMFSLGYAWAGEKEELILKKQVVMERMEKLKAQSALIQLQFGILQQELVDLENRIKAVMEKESKAKPEEKKDAGKNKKN